MTVLHKLQISGIRTFRPNPPDIEHQTITFDEPITVITGENGTGKTTIIESLKVAIKGGIKNCPELISNIDIWSMNEVRAEIVCEFESVDHKLYRVTVNPVLAKTQRNAKGEQLKTGECQVFIRNPDGSEETHEIPTNDIENRIPGYFSVSVPMIENVIFCHQDNSCWPIDDKDSELKAKFDLIFGAEKYKLAVKNLKENEKELEKQKTEVYTAIAREEANLIALEQIERTIREYKGKIQETNHQLTDLSIQFEEIESQYRYYERIKPRLKELDDRIHNYEGQIEIQKSNYLRQYEAITDLKSYEECESLLDSINSDLCSKEEQRNNDKAQLKIHLSNENKYEAKIVQIESELSHKSDLIKEHETAKTLLSGHLQDFENKYQSSNYSKILEIKQREYVEIRNNKTEKTKLQKEKMDKISQEIDTLTRNCDREENLLGHLTENCNELKSELKKFDVNETELVEKQNEYESITQELKEKTLKFTDSNIDKELSQKQNEIEQLNVIYEQLKSEMKISKTYSNDLKKHQELDEKIMNTSAQIEPQLQKIRNQLNREDVSIHNFIVIFQNEKSNALNELENNKKKNMKIEKELNSIETKYQQSEENYQKEKKKFEKSIEKVNAVLSPEDGDYYTLLSNLEESCRSETEELSKLNNSTIGSVYSSFKHKANQCHCCPLCERSFHNETEFESFVHNKIDNKISSIPNEIRERKTKLREAEARIKQLKKIEDDIKTRDLFLMEKENKENEISQLRQSLDQIQTEFEKSKEELAISQKKFDSIRVIDVEIRHLVNLKHEYDTAVINKQRIPIIDENIRSADQISNDIAQIQDQISDRNSQISKLSQKQNQFHSELLTLEMQKNSLSITIQSLKENYQRTLELDEKINQQNQKIKEKRPIIDSFKKEITEKVHEKRVLSDQIEIENEKIDTQVSKVLEQFNTCKHLVSQIEDCKTKLESININEAIEQNQRLQDDLIDQRNNLNKVREFISNLNSKMEESENERNALEQQLLDLNKQKDYYDLLHKYQQLNHEKEKLQLDRKNLLDSLIGQDLDELANSFNSLQTDIGTLQERLKNFTYNLNQNNKESSKYSDTRKLLMKARINYQSLGMAIRDIKNYRDALDETVIEYHKTQMDQINAIIFRLWKATYHGGDIDYIEIKGEREKKRNIMYNYRVVMRKNDVELNMAKRCSAGQKMLASIIIRLALAETFCSNCGIIALDEPTTNLDYNNMINLADALIELVNQRKTSDQRPYQMIIITHNDEFAKKLQSHGTFEKFYQITRVNDGKSSYSQIYQCEN